MVQRDAFTEFDLDVAPEGAPQSGAPETEKEEFVPISRLNEALATRDKAVGQRDDMIHSMLNGSAQGEVEKPTEAPSIDEMSKVEFPEGADPDVIAVLTPILEANNRAVFERMGDQLRTEVGPVVDKIGHAEAVERVASRVEGFNDVRQDIVHMFEGMSPEEQQKNNTEQGLEIMALRAIEARRQATGARPMMAHSAPFGHTGIRPAPARKATEQDIWDMTDEEFENHEARHTRRG